VYAIFFVRSKLRLKKI